MKATIILIALTLSLGCGKKEPELSTEKVITPDEAANELFVEAVGLVSKAQSKEATDIPAAIKSYEQALVKVREITNKYKKSGLAVKLVSDEVLLKGKSIAQIKDRMGELQREMVRRAEEKKRQNLFEGDGPTRLLKEKNYITEISGYEIYIGEKKPSDNREGEFELKNVSIHEFQDGQLVQRIQASRGWARVNNKERKYVFVLSDVQVQMRELAELGKNHWTPFSVEESTIEIPYGLTKK